MQPCLLFEVGEGLVDVFLGSDHSPARLCHANEIKAFIADNDSQLKAKE